MVNWNDLIETMIVFGGGFGAWAYRARLRYQQKVMEMRAMRGEPLDDSKIEIEKLRQEVRALQGKAAQAGTAASEGGEVAALRQEIMRLRDTSTQYDVSLDHTLQELQHRVATLENRLRQTAQGTVPEEIQINSVR